MQTDEGKDLSVLFSLLLEVIDRKGFFQNMSAKPAAANPDKFHGNHWTRFCEGCEPPWLEMTVSQKSKHLRRWMVKKFSLDPRGKCMLPRPGGRRKHRNEISWSGFEMNDAELDGVLDEVMEAYQWPR